MEICETLADTGINQLWLVAGILIALGAGCFFLPHLRKLFLVIPLVFLLAATPLAAQSADPCEEIPLPPGTEENFSLVADNFVLEPESSVYFSLLANDQQLSDDPIDWSTIDLDPETAGIQDELEFSHPDNDQAWCGELYLQAYGIIQFMVYDQCYGWDEEEEEEFTLPLPDAFTFNYTASTYEGVPAPAPALVTITVDDNLPAPVVIAGNDSVGLGETTVNLLANDSTSVGSLDPLTIDLNPALPGIQTSLIYTDNEGVIEFSVDGTGLLTVDYSAHDMLNPPLTFYTVQNTSGTISNIARIMLPVLDLP